MGIGLIILILLLGAVCLFAEFFLFPGFSIAGIAGVLIMAAAVYLAYGIGTTEGHVVFLAAIVISVLTFWFGVRYNKFAVDAEIDSKVNLIDSENILVGDIGEAVSALRPGGTALVNNIRLEVFTTGDFVDSGKKLIVTKVTENKVFVKLANDLT